MENTLERRSDILKKKGLFFLNRAVTYFTFLLIPVWLKTFENVNGLNQFIFILFYILFMLGQWYLLGKEVDHRLKIYYRTTSSMDRIIYRSITGSIVLVLIFNMFSIFTDSVQPVLFWTFFGLIGLFYSWPTRGKIIKESVFSQFNEYKFLDSFEKSVLFIIFLMFVFTLPEVPKFESTEALKLYLDPNERISPMFWNYLSMLFLPLKDANKIYFLSWFVFIYVLGFGLFLITFYGVLRFFYSRRISILGVFGLISSWSCTKLMEENPIYSLTTTYSLIWIWSILWAVKSHTYRSGLMIGLVHFMGVLINPKFIYLTPITLFLVSRYFFQKRTNWYRRQIFKYMILGILCMFIAYSLAIESSFLGDALTFNSFFKSLKVLFARKSFFILSLFGFISLFLYRLKSFKRYVRHLKVEDKRIKDIGLLFLCLAAYSIIFDQIFFYGFAMMAFLSFLSVFPLEWLFQSLTQQRSRRNVIFFFYILVCLLDSHFEGRIKIFFHLLNY